MNVKFTTQRFPINPSVKDGSGAIWGCVVQPFRNNTKCMDNVDNIARCGKCYAYMNNYVQFEKGSWRCNICERVNPIDQYHGDQRKNKAMVARYSDPDNRLSYPEITNNNIVLSNEQETQQQPDTLFNSFLVNPIYIAVVDVSGNSTQMDTIKNGLEALIHALPDNCLFGMVIFSYKIGLFNLNCTIPIVKYIDVFSATNDIGFEDILPLTSFLVNKSKFETNILNAISTIPCIDQTIGNVNNSKGGSVRALGPTLELLVNYLKYDNIKFNVKSGIFLSGKPSFGNGAIEKEYSDVESLHSSFESTHFLKPSTMFYKELSEQAIQVGAHFDMYCIGRNYYGFDTIKFLSTCTGGNIYRYDQLINSNLPQDIYKLISSGWGFHGLLRIRTSKHFSIDNCFGNLIESGSFENLYHIESCSPYTSVAFDFKFTDPSAFEGTYNTPFIQIAFSYSYLPPVSSLSESTQHQLVDSAEYTSPQRNHRVIEKRIQIYNASFQVSNTPAELFNFIDLESTICLLTQKIIKEINEKGILESRLLLLAWLGNFVTKYNENVYIQSSVRAEIDLSFSQMLHLKQLPRYVFALLKGPLLRQITKSNQDQCIQLASDEWVLAQCTYASLEPRVLHRAIYPVLYSYGAPNNLASKYLTLSKTTIQTGNSHIYMVDSYHQIIVYYEPVAVTQHTFPPPSDSLIRQTIVNSKQDRLAVPQVYYTTGDINQSSLESEQLINSSNTLSSSQPLTPLSTFTKLLIEDDTQDGHTYLGFLNDLETNLKNILY